MEMTPNRGPGAGCGSFGSALPGSGRASFGQASANALSMRWSALHDAAAAVAALARVSAEPMDSLTRGFPARIRDVGGWRRDLAEQGVDDLSAIMQPGLAALLAVHARGGDARAAGLALWQEFVSARDALLAILPSDSVPTRPAS